MFKKAWAAKAAHVSCRPTLAPMPLRLPSADVGFVRAGFNATLYAGYATSLDPVPFVFENAPDWL